MISSLLQLCSRATTSPELAKRIGQCCTAISLSDWDELPALAEQQGLAPLLHWHLQALDIACPDHIRRTLRILFLRHRQCNQVMTAVLKEVLVDLRQANIDVLVLKGAALSHTIYPEIGLRPMRDIDLLLRKEQAGRAEEILIEKGFCMSTAPRSDDHYHLPALFKKVDSVPVCFELHHGLFPDCPPYYRKPDFDTLISKAQPFDLQGVGASCLGNEDMLWHVFEHGFHTPLSYEAFRLIAVADLVTMVEKRFEQIDWAKMNSEHPRIVAALPLVHHLTPWPDEVVSKLGLRLRPAPAEVGKAFQGWPHLRMAEQRDKRLLPLLRDTFLPPEWWTRLYYGISNWWEWLVCRCYTHPRYVFWWARLYATYLEPSRESCDAPKWPRKIGIGGNVRRFINMALALLKKLPFKSP